MAVYRQIQVSFWQDPFVIGLTPEEKYFYIYLMSNSKTTQCGIYELPKRVMEFETGYNRETIDKLLLRFIDYGKIMYHDPSQEIMLLNWYKYNFLKSPKVVSKIKQELLTVKADRFREKVLCILEETGLSDKTLYRMANKTEIPRTMANQIFERDKTCVRCGSDSDLTIDHIYPRNIGGTNVVENLRVLCRSCNSKRPTIGKALEDDLLIDGLSLNDFEKICQLIPNQKNSIPYQNSDSIGYQENEIPYRQEEKEKEEEKEREEKGEEEKPHHPLSSNSDFKDEITKMTKDYDIQQASLYSIDQIYAFHRVVENEVIIAALKKASGKHVNYAINTLTNWVKEGKTKIIDINPPLKVGVAPARTQGGKPQIEVVKPTEEAPAVSQEELEEMIRFAEEMQSNTNNKRSVS